MTKSTRDVLTFKATHLGAAVVLRNPQALSDLAQLALVIMERA